MKTQILLLVALFSTFAMSVGENAEPNSRLLTNVWEADWITHPDVDGEAIGVFLFKKELELTHVPEDYIINVSADNRYILYVNGEVVGRGPTRGDVNRWLFETIDIAAFLKPGMNHIAAKVWNMAHLKPLAQMSYQTGLIVQGNSEKEQAINTDSSWIVSMDESYSFFRIGHLKRFYASGPGEIFEGTLHPWNWQLSSDLQWKKAKATRKGAPLKSLTLTGKPVGPQLFPTAIPMMESFNQSFKAVRRVEGIVGADALIVEEGSVRIPANQSVKILLDHGQLTNAYPQLHYSKGAGSEVKITYAESLFIPEEDGKPTYHKGNRDVVDGKVMWGNYDILKPDGGDDRLFEPLWWRCFRYVELEITTQDEPLLLKKFESEFTAYPLELKADFQSDNPMLKEVFDVAWHTQRLCAGETFYDCPYYEQLQYTGDTRIQGLITAYASGDTLLWKDAILDYYDSRFPFGLTQSRYPSSQTQIIGTFSLVWITMVYDYMMHCGDDAFIQKMIPAILDILTWYDERVEDDGQLGKLETWLFMDWVEGWKLGYPPLTDEGKHSSIIGMQYVYTLQKATKIFDTFGYSGLSKRWAEKAIKTQQAVVDACWDEQKNMFADTPEKKSHSQHVNILAVLSDTLEDDQQKDLMLRILKDDSIYQSTYYFDFYLVQALKKVGLADLYVETLKPLKAMIDNGLTTFVEKPEPTRSDCHAWSASPVYYYYSLIAGIVPAEKGFKSVEMRPSLGELNFIEGSMPLKDGTISFKLEKEDAGGLKGWVVLPDDLPGNLYWKDTEMKLLPGKNEIELE